MIFFISLLHEVYLSIGSRINRDLVLIDQPRTVFNSEGRPSAENFFNEIISFRGISSRGSKGQAIVCIAKRNGSTDTLNIVLIIQRDTNSIVDINIDFTNVVSRDRY
jgi:hypothetical protein